MSTVCLYIEGDAQGKSEVTMAEGSPQGKREALIRLVKERMARPEYADSPSVMLVCHFFLRLLNALENADPDEWESLYDIKRKIMQGDTRTIHLIAEDESCSDDSTPEGMRRDILRILDSIIEETSSEGRIFCSFFRNALHVAREENSCIQATIAKKENNTYDVALKITIPPIEPESAPLATAGETERRSIPDTSPDAPPPPRARSGRREAPNASAKAKNVIVLSEERMRRKPVREQLAHIVTAHLARCEEEEERDTALLCEAAECAVALQDRQAAQRLMKWESDEDPAEDVPVDIVTIERLELLAGETESVREKLTSLEEAGAGYYEAAALIALAIPDPQAALRLIPKLEAEGLLRTAAIVVTKIGDRESALRIMQRAKDQGVEILDEKTLGAFTPLALFDTQLAKEIMDLFAIVADSDDPDNVFIDVVLHQVGCIAMALDERGTARRMAEALQKRDSPHLAMPLFGMLGELQIVQELMLKIEKEKPEFWNDLYWSVLVDISRYNLEAGFEVLKLLERRGYDIGLAAARMLDLLYWIECDVGKRA